MARYRMFKRITDWFSKSPTTDRGANTAAAPLRRCEQCEQQQVVHITLLQSGVVEGEKHLCEACGQKFFASRTAVPNNRENIPLNTDQAIPIEVDLVVISEKDDRQVIFFREVEGIRHFPLVTGIFEATCIVRTLKQMPSPRPLTYDAWLSTLTALGATVNSAVFSKIDEDCHTYYADLRLRQAGDLIAVDMRPSDAVHMALKVNAPILIGNSLLERVSLTSQSPI